MSTQKTKVVKAEIHIPEERIIKVEIPNEAPKGWTGKKCAATINKCLKVLDQSHQENKKHNEKIIRELHFAHSRLAKRGRRKDLHPNELTWAEFLEELDMSETTVWRMLKRTDPRTGKDDAKKAAELREKNRKTQNGKFFKILEELNITEVDCPKCHVCLECPKCKENFIDQKSLAALIHSEVEKKFVESLEKLKKSNGKSKKNGKVVEENKEKSVTHYSIQVKNPVGYPGDPPNEFTKRLSKLGFKDEPGHGVGLTFRTEESEEAKNVASDAKDVLNSWKSGMGESIKIVSS